MNGLQAKVENYLNNLEGRIKPSSLTYDGVGGPYFKPEIKQKILNSCQDFVVFNLRSFSDKVLDGELNEGFYWVTRGREIFLELAGNQDFTGKLFVKFSSWVMPMKIYDITGIISSFVPSRLGDRDYFLVIASQIVRDKSSIRNFDGRDEWYLNLNDNNSWKILNCDELKEKLDRVIIPPKTSDMNKKKFYNKGGEYFEFTNFFPASFTIREIPPNLGLSPYLIGDWETSEHLFQAAKFNDQAIIEEIRQATTAREVFNLANSTSGTYSGQIRGDWNNDNIKLGIMKWVVKEKFTQNETLKTKLLNTGDAELIEDTENDMRNAGEPWKKDRYWGNATKYDRRTRTCLNIPGDNHLGKILMEIRQELVSNPTPPNPTPPPTSKDQFQREVNDCSNWNKWKENYQKISLFSQEEQKELEKDLLNNLVKIINYSKDLTTLNNLQSNWRNHQFYTQNSERAAKIDQFYNNRRQEIEQKNTSLPSSQPKNNFLTDHWQIVLIAFLAFVISIAFIQRRKKSNLKK